MGTRESLDGKYDNIELSTYAMLTSSLDCHAAVSCVQGGQESELGGINIGMV